MRVPADSNSDPGSPTSRRVVSSERDSRRDGLGNVGMPPAHVVEGTVRLHVAKPDALGPRDGGQRANLSHHKIRDVFGCETHFAASETLNIAETRMGANRYARSDRQADGVAHDVGIARMKSTRNVSGCDGAQETFVVFGVVNTGELTDVGVQVDTHGDQNSSESSAGIFPVMPSANASPHRPGPSMCTPNWSSIRTTLWVTSSSMVSGR